MSFKDRESKILEYLSQNREITIEELCAKLFVSAPTIRRDLKSLAESGKIIRTHGGAYLTGLPWESTPQELREKEYDMYHYGLKHFGRKVAGDYPRVGILEKGDTMTTNCLQYDDGEFASEEALFEALAAWKDAPVYVVPVVGSSVPKLTATKPEEGTFGKVCKFYTMPNDEPGVKYQITNI